MHAPTVITSLLLSSAVAGTIVYVGRPASDSEPDPNAVAAQHEVGQLREQLATLSSRLEEVAVARSESTAAPSVDRVAVPTVSPEQVAVAVEAYLEDRRQGGGKPAEAALEPESTEAMFAAVNGSNFWDNSEAWRKAFAAGRMDELIDMFEEAAEANPNDVDKQMALASAYMAYMQLDNTKWNLSMKADEMYDKVLKLDERHWEARFTKAVSYTFWPKFLGKDKAAISHFEILVEQQESSPVQDSQAQTYLYLGNLLEEKDPKRAREMWQRGATRHPNNEELRNKINN
ncbi:MAG: hypothetical protein NXI31_00050 [bacterium]|nr:hypothetical protein [bacterium]